MCPFLFPPPLFSKVASIFSACQDGPRPKEMKQLNLYFFIFLKEALQARVYSHQDNQSMTEHNSSYKYSCLIIFHCSKGDYILKLKSVCRGLLHVQSSHRGSFRKAGVFFRKETVRVTSSPAFLKTWTWKVKTREYFHCRSCNL